MSKEYIKNLIVVACTDGVLTEEEMIMLIQKSGEIGISETELQEWIDKAEELILHFPEDMQDRERILIEMINVSNADGDFSQDEYDLCQIMAEKLPYSGLTQALSLRMNRSHLKNLVALACSDGTLDHSELLVLQEAAASIEVSSEELNELIAHSKEFQYLIPESYDDRETQLIQMLTLAIADGEFSQDEYNLCKMVAEKLDFSERELQLIIRLCFKGQQEFEKNEEE
jgi:uncharacterized tellurite resistance protein B-like protein